jgi:hypothetical protein
VLATRTAPAPNAWFAALAMRVMLQDAKRFTVFEARVDVHTTKPFAGATLFPAAV